MRVLRSLSTRLRLASARDLRFAAVLALAASVVLQATSRAPQGAFFVAVLFGMAIGLGLLALGASRRERTRG